jgi:hypothetical protein
MRIFSLGPSITDFEPKPILAKLLEAPFLKQKCATAAYRASSMPSWLLFPAAYLPLQKEGGKIQKEKNRSAIRAHQST